MKVISVVAFATLLTISISARAELVQQFKNPAFNGQGWSSHALTIDSIEKSRRDQIEADRKAAIAKSEAELTAIPKSAACNTGASFNPSPTKATF